MSRMMTPEDCSSLASSRNLKVTLLISESGSSTGGLSIINLELAIQLAKRDNVEVCMYFPRFSDEDKNAAADCRISLLKAKERARFNDPIDWLAFIPRDQQMDVVIGHWIHLRRQVPLIKETHPECKWVQVVHTDPEELGMFKTYPDPTAKGEKKHETAVKLCQEADQVVAVGPKLTAAFARYLRSCGDVLNLTSGIFSEFAGLNEATKERKVFHVFLFGHGDDEDFQLKGYDIAAQAASMLNKPLKRLFVGAPHGKEEEVKATFLDKGISCSQLIVRSANERKQLAQQFCQADLVIMPSRTEGLGLAALEPLSAGPPVLVSGNSGLGESLEEVLFGTNVVVKSEDPKAKGNSGSS
ncbi:D-inositol 3-phosphate glycosyltransferase [Acropora cervicornis]|uniref:D-inositol 3-phosphate glycosyltransferase n=1 Tax=Acropora cervicornis TaxID=6130 RepID=A0AAD9PQ03_ACRCE|nr:D-inositol 3-phosphate glycosyltransferase [Acropora cervicornis]